MNMPPPPPLPPPIDYPASAPDLFPYFVGLTAAQQHDALSHHTALERSLKHLMASHQHPDTDAADTIAAMQVHMQGLKDFLSQISQTAIYNEVRAPDSTAAHNAFQVPELLELILSELTLQELLQMQRVSRYMKTTIENSGRLQTMLFFKPAPSYSRFTAPDPWEVGFIAPGFTCDPVDVEEGFSKVKNLNIKASFRLRAKQTLPPITPNGRKMLVCQPPIQEMEVKVECCLQAWAIEGPETRPAIPPDLALPWPFGARTLLACKLQNPTGLTIGELHDCAREVIEKHRYCPHATYRALDEHGLVDAGLHFKGKVTVRDDDPALEALTLRQQEAARSMKSKRWGQRRVKREYAHAKRNALSDYKPIPTLMQWATEKSTQQLSQGITSPDGGSFIEYVAGLFNLPLE